MLTKNRFTRFIGSCAALAVLSGAMALAAPDTNEIAPVPAVAQKRVASVQIIVSPDHQDWSYKVGEKVKFTVRVMADNELLEGVRVAYRVAPDMMPAEEVKAVVSANGLVIDGGTMKTPGFLRCVVTANVGGKNYRGLATAGFEPEKIKPTQTEPKDFDAFWNEGKAELAKIPLDAKRTLLPEYCTSTVNVYHVSFRTVGSAGGRYQSRFYGILCEPKAPGKYPAILRVPGAGVRPYVPVNTSLAERGAITLNVGIHGFPVNLIPEAYDQMRSSTLRGYHLYNLDDKNAYYYRRVYLSCVRANDYLTSLPNWNGKDLVVTGGSQGGQLTIVTSGLDLRVTGCAAQFPAYCDVTGYLHGRAGGWPHMFRPDSKTGKNFHAENPLKIETTSYYDAVNFAKRIKAPGHYYWGYNDETCPPTSMHAAYNQIKAPKVLDLALIAGHPIIPEATDAVNAWIVDFLKLPAANL
ncbi:cephalosporin-C deacetylase [Ereboglobus sp. PH5-5]|uniref:acetylxylan esterase n=1 Tax=Ereboglobus sp. PH5-5 TaxID=2940529 RepID=UPI002405A7D5|nr:acetylxylan esterase [Ereboglobus sp. PH5-5]MDF9832594.1 cephalosporin-C deacetylase [Ereboglobus sp. PH5-5]